MLKWRCTRALGICAAVVMSMSFLGCAPKQAEPPEPPTPLEHRAVWVLAPQIEGGPVAVGENLRQFQNAHTNVLCVNIQKRGYVLYPGSALLPQFPAMAGEDVYADLIRQAHEMGMKVEAWTEYGFYAYHTLDASKDPSRGAWLDAHPGLVSVDSTGNSVIHNEQWGDFYSLDSANPAAQDLLLDMAVEIVRRYPFDGINLDRIRFATATHGYSDFCREKFRTDTGMDLFQVQVGNDVWKRWREWRKEQLTLFMERASKRLRAERPGLRITMATVPPEMIDDLGQDWPAWLQRGYLDAAYPMLYGPNPQARYDTVRTITNNHPNVFMGLDLTIGVEPFQQAVDAWRALGYKGVTIWQSDALVKHEESTRVQVFPEKAQSPLYWGR